MCIRDRTKHVKPTQEGETGRILTEEASLHASNVMFFSKDKNLTSKIEYFIDKDQEDSSQENAKNSKKSQEEVKQ